ncbi:T9SS type A sorting domain-containing protein [bacterium]|nr:T9SS type A sorting domain-containing protein [bacterium]
MKKLLICVTLAVVAASSHTPPLDPSCDALALEAAAKAGAAAKAVGRGEPVTTGGGFDQIHLDLDLILEYYGEISPVWCTLDGTATWTLESTQSGLGSVEMELADELTVTEVRRDSVVLDYTHEDDVLTVTLDQSFDGGERFTISIDYNGIPAYGMYADSDNDGIIHTFTEPYNSSGWFPCYDSPDDRFTCDQHYTIRDDWLVASNGELVSEVDNGDGTRTYNWEADFDMPTYLVAVGASDYHFFYDEFDIGHGPQRVDNWVYRDHAPEAEEDLSITPEMVEHCSTLFTDYKYSRYGHMITEIGGAMEHTTTTSYSSGLITGDHTFDWVVVHELGHQWFGDWITCETWENIWLNEGFASYVEALWAEYIYGDVGLQSYMARFKAQYFYEDAYYRYPLYDPLFLFGTTVYKKGAWVLHMLRHLGEDDAFFDMLADYVNAFPDGTVTTEEFIAVADDYYGGDSSLDTYFEQWVYMAGYPEYDMIVWNEETSNGWIFHVQLSQVQDYSDEITPEVFVTPIDLRLVTIEGSVDVVFDNDQRVDDQAFSVPASVSRVVFDPGGWFLYKLLSSDAPVVDLCAVPNEDGVLVTWAAEGDVHSVELYRNDGVGEIKLHQDGLDVRGRFLDRPAFPGSYRYRLETLSSDGSRQSYFSGWVDWRESAAPLALSAPWPCPSVEVFHLVFALPQTSTVEIALFDLAGRRVGILGEGVYAAGRHEVDCDTAGLTSGVYLIRLQADAGALTRRIVITR